jgi:hypothetical protein
MSLNSFLAGYDTAFNGSHVGPFVGRYAYIHLDSGVMLIVLYSPNSGIEIAMNGS